MSNIGQDRLVRVCDYCGGVDDHPRHVIAGNPGTGLPDPAVVTKILDLDDIASADRAALIADLYDTTLVLRHLDCCRAAGCPDGTCSEQTAGAEDLRGVDLLDHLMTGKG
jgi:hypothetical protein